MYRVEANCWECARLTAWTTDSKTVLQPEPVLPMGRSLIDDAPVQHYPSSALSVLGRGNFSIGPAISGEQHWPTPRFNLPFRAIAFVPPQVWLLILHCSEADNAEEGADSESGRSAVVLYRALSMQPESRLFRSSGEVLIGEGYWTVESDPGLPASFQCLLCKPIRPVHLSQLSSCRARIVQGRQEGAHGREEEEPLHTKRFPLESILGFAVSGLLAYLSIGPLSDGVERRLWPWIVLLTIGGMLAGWSLVIILEWFN
jgi:hypothetical protein